MDQRIKPLIIMSKNIQSIQLVFLIDAYLFQKQRQVEYKLSINNQ